MSNEHKGDPYAAWAGAEKRLQNAMETIEALRARVEAAERERDELKMAIECIAEFDASNRNGYVDEWEEAWAFGECKKIAAALAAKGVGTVAPVDMGQVNGVNLTYVDGNIFATPAKGKTK